MSKQNHITSDVDLFHYLSSLVVGISNTQASTERREKALLETLEELREDFTREESLEAFRLEGLK